LFYRLDRTKLVLAGKSPLRQNVAGEKAEAIGKKKKISIWTINESSWLWMSIHDKKLCIW
jgi:hypothetical protein